MDDKIKIQHFTEFDQSGISVYHIYNAESLSGTGEPIYKQRG
ncbi:MAG: hypothetical protein K0R22_2812 [Sporomusa sp.]|jgi:hypothetical protein|nr:hypothetical protein [Sporomusa sp.]MDF2876129.1 hypothetical protein [Sporomusa sp.]